ncbi:BT0820 family HAD-type phosphatase [Yeosuana marina]|uniref:BT0820 family HAD-type phosphatase n=1 Tax=Yeosuana marina TaxID=1565536 RepID=UPI00141EFF0B|nr:hydrolase [Yeosuana marina]|tara:strand:- start:270 stop:686 length:417 start_codon:yes stop_codon:yes gene_type:complete
MNFNDKLIIAVDFDGTIVEDAYPKVGKPMLFAFETLKKLQEEGHRLILWTYRSGDTLDEAVKFCEDNGIFFYAVNKSFPEEEYKTDRSRKIHADLFIDDRNIGGFIGWGKVYQILIGHEDMPNIDTYKKKKSLLDFFK